MRPLFMEFLGGVNDIDFQNLVTDRARSHNHSQLAGRKVGHNKTVKAHGRLC